SGTAPPVGSSDGRARARCLTSRGKSSASARATTRSSTDPVMKITLLSPRIALQKSDYLGSGVPYWPIELAWLAAGFREKKHDVSVLDLFGSSPTTLEDRGDHFLQGMPLTPLTESAAVREAQVFILYAISYMSHADLLSSARLLRTARPEAP